MSLTPAGFWNGQDGNWSTFKLSVGTPWQSFHVLVSTGNHQIKVPFSAYCEYEGNPWGPDCGALRGVNDLEGHTSDGFRPQKSKTWNAQKREDMTYFAFDPKEIDNSTGFNVGPGFFFHGGRELKIEEADLEKEEFLGSLGMSAIAGSWYFWTPAMVRFSMNSVANASFLQALTWGTWLPETYGYTAGASYRNAPASLTIGHYNSSLMLPGARSFSFSSDHDLKVHLAYIKTTKTLFSNQSSFLAKDVLVVLDSTEPYLKFPESICREFVSAFGLQFEQETGLFLVNSSTRTWLQKVNPSLTLGFTGGVKDDGSTFSDMEIVLPYASFDLEIRRTLKDSPRAYFPLRIGADDDFNVLGRAFFQETYLIVNYVYNNFTISQRSFIQVGPNGPDLIRIHAERGSSVGLVLGVIILFFLLLGYIMLFALPFAALFYIPRFIITTLVEKPRAQRLETRQRELSKRWEEAHRK